MTTTPHAISSDSLGSQCKKKNYLECLSSSVLLHNLIGKLPTVIVWQESTDQRCPVKPLAKRYLREFSHQLSSCTELHIGLLKELVAG